MGLCGTVFFHVPVAPDPPPLSRMTIPEERIDRLEDQAAAAARRGEEDHSRAYVRLARRIAERHRLRFPRPFERRTCDRCDTYQIPSRNVRVRLQNGHVVMTCDCGGQTRYPYD